MDVEQLYKEYIAENEDYLKENDSNEKFCLVYCVMLGKSDKIDIYMQKPEFRDFYNENKSIVDFLVKHNI